MTASQNSASSHGHQSGPLRDDAGVAKYRHEALAVILRAHPQRGLEALLTQRTTAPYAQTWTLPSGPVEVHESLEQAITRHVQIKTGVSRLTYLEQLSTSSAPERDPFDRTIATSYLGLVAWTYDPDLPDHVAWHPVSEPLEFGFDHDVMLSEAVERLRAKLSYTNIAYALAPETFTLSQLRDAYEHVLDHDISATNLKRILTRRAQIEATGEKGSSGSDGGRPAGLFRFTSTTLKVTDPFAVLKPHS